jgi:phage tail sheath protein FI
LKLPASSLVAVYYPWVKVKNPYSDRAKRPRRPATVLAPPCGFAAGVWARSAAVKGIWAAPAGVDTVLRGAVGLGHAVTAKEQQQLVPLGVNCLRGSGSGPPIARGSREAEQGDWRALSVSSEDTIRSRARC